MQPIETRYPYSHSGQKNYRVTLIRPPAIWSGDSMNISSITPPLNLAYLSSALRNDGFSVTNIDAIGEGITQIRRLDRNPKMEALGLSARQILDRIPEDTRLIGVSCMFSLEWPGTRDLIFEIRKSFPNTPIVIGGEHASALPEFSMNECHAVDYVICGEGEALLLKLSNDLRQGLSPSDAAGLYYRENGVPTRSLSTPTKRTLNGPSGERIKKLDTLKWPAWELTPLQNYLDHKMSIGRYVGRTMPVMGSRGCPYECTFCSNPSMWGRLYLTRSPKDLVDEIVYYKQKYGIEAVEFYDLTPIIKKSWILDFCNELIDRKVGIQWQISGGTRCEAIDEEVIIRAKMAGCGYIGFAPESSVQEVLDRIKKKVKIPHMMKLIRYARKHGVDTRCNIIIGFPEDTRSQIYQALWFQMKLALMGVVDSPIFAFTPYPGSELFDRLRKEGVIESLSDEYFESLGLNLQLQNRRRYCKAMGPLELLAYRTIGMTLFYGFYYAVRPKKLISFVANLFRYNKSNSVFEQRIIQHVKKLMQKLRNKFRPAEISPSVQ